jgi:hypothetical protein
MRPILMPLDSVNQRALSGPAAIPRGSPSAVGIGAGCGVRLHEDEGEPFSDDGDEVPLKLKGGCRDVVGGSGSPQEVLAG